MPQELIDERARNLIRAALENAHALLADAQLMFDHERWARAHGLAVFAMEEIGKAWLAQHPDAYSGGKGLEPSRDHQQKLTAARQMMSLFEQISAHRPIDVEEWFSEGHGYEAEKDFNDRMAGLYVDLVNSEVVGGSSSVPQVQAESTLALADEVVHAGLRVLWPTDESDVEEGG